MAEPKDFREVRPDNNKKKNTAAAAAEAEAEAELHFKLGHKPRHQTLERKNMYSDRSSLSLALGFKISGRRAARYSTTPATLFRRRRHSRHAPHAQERGEAVGCDLPALTHSRRRGGGGRGDTRRKRTKREKTTRLRLGGEKTSPNSDKIMEQQIVLGYTTKKEKNDGRGGTQEKEFTIGLKIILNLCPPLKARW